MYVFFLVGNTNSDITSTQARAIILSGITRGEKKVGRATGTERYTHIERSAEN